MRHMRPLVIFVALLCVISCAKPPQPEIDAAKAALDAAAKNADVVTYAPDSLRAAQEKMAELDAEIAAQARRPALSRSYDTAKSLALEAADHARKAGADAAATKERVARDAAALAEEVTAAIPLFESKVWAAKRVPRIKLDVITPLAYVPGQARATVLEAQKDIEGGAFATAKAKLMAVKDQLSACEETITEQTRIAKSR
jgi:alkanesulfonate monooxygenase SsuD/methylene tetrahydromethanopterin reductase-like flavin-dependent oxidoreductase (luciferase family)